MTNTSGTCRHQEKMVITNNAEKFKQIFGIYATELWAMPEDEFLKWLGGTDTGGSNERWASEIEEFPIAVTKHHFGEE